MTHFFYSQDNFVPEYGFYFSKTKNKNMKTVCIYSALVVSSLVLFTSCNKEEDNGPIVITAAGQIQASIDEFRGLLGDNNGNAAGSKPSVRITYGNAPLGPDDGGSIDVSVMDDFIFGEPQPVE